MIDKRTTLGKMIDENKMVFYCVKCGYTFVGGLKDGLRHCANCNADKENVVIRGDLMVIK